MFQKRLGLSHAHVVRCVVVVRCNIILTIYREKLKFDKTWMQGSIIMVKNVLHYTTTTYYYYCSFFICIWRCELRTEEQFIFIPYHYKAEMYYVYHVGKRKNKYGTLLKFQLKAHSLLLKIIQRDVKLITWNQFLFK